MFASFAGGYVYKNYTPKYNWLMYSSVCLITTISAYFMSPKLESNEYIEENIDINNAIGQEKSEEIRKQLLEN